MRELVKERLAAFGYEVKPCDETLVRAAAIKSEDAVKRECGLQVLSEELIYAAVDMAAGEFLFFKKVVSPDDIKGFDFNTAVKRIKLGDSDTVFAVGEGSLSEEQRFDSFVEYLRNSGRKLYGSYRRVRW